MPTGARPATAAPPADSFSLAVEENKDAQLFKELSSLTAQAPLEHYFSNLHRTLAKVMNAPILIVGTRDVAAPLGFRPRFRRDLTHADADPVIEQRFVEAALKTGKPVIHGQFGKLPTGGFLRQSEDSCGSVMVSPMLLEGRIVGYLAVRNPNDGAFDDRDLERFAAVAHLAAIVVQNDLTVDEAQARRAELQLMLEATRILASERDVVRFFEALHGLVSGVMDAQTFWVGLGSWTNGGRISIPYCVHDRRRIDIPEPIPMNGSVAGNVYREGMPVIVRSPSEWRPYPVVEQGSRDGINSGIVMPLLNGYRMVGVVSAQSSNLSAYSVRERDLLEVLAQLAAIAIETSRQQNELADSEGSAASHAGELYSAS